MVESCGLYTKIIDILSLLIYKGINPNEKNILVRIVLRSLERTLTNDECNEYRDIIYRHISTKEGYMKIK